MTLLLHGIVPIGTQIPSPQIGDDELGLHIVESSELALVATVLPDGYSLTEGDAVRHLDVLVAIVRSQAVLPLRFGTLAPDDSAVMEEILGAPIADDFRRHLDAVRDLVELRLTFTLHEDMLQILFNEDAELRELVEHTGSNAGMSERLELGRFVAERLSARRAELVARWICALENLVEEATSLASSDEGWEQIALLVRREQLADIDDAVATLVATVGVRARVEYVGPLPIYSFGWAEAMEQAVETSTRSGTAPSST